LRELQVQELHELKEMFKDVKAFVKWVLLGILVGDIVGLVSVAFHFAVDYATKFRITHSFIVFMLPLGGLFIVWFYKALGVENDQGTNYVLVSCREEKTVPFKLTPLIFVGTTVTHLFGGSAGREGAALQMGSSISNTIGRLFKFDNSDMNIMSMCGMAAAFSALFGTPVTAAIFSIEVIHIGVMRFSALLPCIVASITGYLVSKYLGVSPTVFNIKQINTLDVSNMCRVLMLAVLCAFVSTFFCYVLKKTAKFYADYFENKYLRAAVGGIIIVVITLIAGTGDYNGMGMDVIKRMFNGRFPIYAFLLKTIFTAFTLGAGFKGGEIVPSFYVGAAFGNAVAPIFGISPAFGAGIGIISVFCGVTNCPVAALVLGVELFGAQGMVYYAAACAVSYMLSGYTSLYTSQKILYSKRRDERIDIMAK